SVVRSFETPGDASVAAGEDAFFEIADCDLKAIDRCSYLRREPSSPPDVLHRPATRPAVVGLVAVRADRGRGRAQLNQRLNRKSALAEQADPFAIGELEAGRLAGLVELVETPIVEFQPFGGMIGARRPSNVKDRGACRKRQQPSGA